MDLGNLGTFFFGFSLLINAVLLGLAVYVLWRMEHSTDRASQSIDHSARLALNVLHTFQSLHKEFRDWGKDLRLWSHDFKLWSKVFVESAQEAFKTPSAATVNEDTFTSVIEQWTASASTLGTEKMEELTEELEGLIQVFAKESRRRQNNATGEQTAPAPRLSREQQHREILELQSRLDESNRVIYDLRRENRTAYTSIAALESLRQTNSKLFAELKSQRDMARQQETSLEKLQHSVDKLATDPPVFSSATSGIYPTTVAANGAKEFELQSRLQLAETDLAKLSAQLNEADAAMDRALREKKMVEDRLLELLNVEN